MRDLVRRQQPAAGDARGPTAECGREKQPAAGDATGPTQGPDPVCLRPLS
jgi:hypothetical protein